MYKEESLTLAHSFGDVSPVSTGLAAFAVSGKADLTVWYSACGEAKPFIPSWELRER